MKSSLPWYQNKKKTKKKKERKLQVNVFDDYKWNNLKNISKLNPKIYKMITYCNQIALISESQGQLNICKSNNVIHYCNKLKNKNPMIISINVKKAFYKIQRWYKIKTLINVVIGNMIKTLINISA